MGPGFFATLRQQGIRLNLLAAIVVLLGAVSAPLIGWLAGFDAAAVLRIFAGASINIPSLGAATQTLSSEVPRNGNAGVGLRGAGPGAARKTDLTYVAVKRYQE